LKIPSYAGFKDTYAGLLEVLALRVSLESTGEAGKSTARGPFEVVVVTLNAPPTSETEVRLIEAFTGLGKKKILQAQED
jgi:hypothetical protein